MTALRELLAADPLLQVLLQLGLFAALVATAMALAVRWARGPLAQHALARAGLAALLLLPPAVLAARAFGGGVALLPAPAATGGKAAAAAAAGAVAEQVQQEGEPQTLAWELAPEAASPVPAPWSWPSAGGLVLGSWLGLSGLLLLGELRRWLRLRRAVRAGTAADQGLQHRLATLAADLHLRRLPRIAVLDQLGCPATFGVLRPVLLLPRQLAAGDAAPAAVLRHELAHLALGHHREGALQLAARCLFGWLPPVRALARALGRAQEQLADNAALAAATDRLGYARALVGMAERACDLHPAPLLLQSLGDRELEHRIHRLLAEDSDMRYRPSRRCRLGAFAALATAAATPLPFSLLPAQAPPPQVAGMPAAGDNSAAAFLPLAMDSVWKWHVTQTDGDASSERDETARVWGSVPARDGQLVAQLQVVRGQYVNWEYLAARADGVFRYRNAYLGGLRGVAGVDERLLPAPVGAVTQWEWDSHLSYQTMAGAPQPNREATRVHHVARLLGVAEAVTVPAGSWPAAHVQIVSTGASSGTRELWFARGVGLVKELTTSGSRRSLRELVAFEPGRAVAFDADALLQQWRAANGWAAGTVAWLPPGEEACYLRGRFAVLRDGDRATCALAAPAGVNAFAADDAAFWTAQVRTLVADRDAGVDAQRRADPSEDLQIGCLATAAARLQALLQRCTDLRAGGLQTEQQLGANPSTTIHAGVRAIDADGQPVRVQAVMLVEQDAVKSVKLATSPERTGK